MREFGGLKRGEPQGRRPELCAVEPAQVVGERLGGQAAETLEELDAGDAFTPSGSRWCAGAAYQSWLSRPCGRLDAGWQSIICFVNGSI